VDQASGDVRRRRHAPAFEALMADARRRRFDCVLVWKYDRFARSLGALIAALQEFRDLDVDFISHTQAIDNTTPMGRLFFHVMDRASESDGIAHLALFDGAFDQTLGVAYTDYVRRFLDPNDTPATPSYYRGDRVKIDWQGNIHLMPRQILTAGAEHQLDEINDSAPVQAQMTNDAVFLQLQSSFGERLFNTTSVRYDDNDRFGGKTTFRIAPAVLIPETGTKFKASVGTGFKAPSLDELFDSYPQFNFFAIAHLG